MALNVVHDSIDDIPEGYQDLYTEREGKMHLTGIGGIKTQADIDRQQVGLDKERDDHKATKLSLSAWGDLNPSEVIAKLDKMPELEIMAKGNKDEFEAQLEGLVETRITSRIAPVERDNKTLKTQLGEAVEELGGLKTAMKKRAIQDNVLESAIASKVLTGVMDDVKLLADAVFEVADDGTILTKENPYGITPGLTSDLWLQEMQEKRPHWWPLSEGGGSKGSGGATGFSVNPWMGDEGKWNLTEQGKIVTQHGMDKANQMAKAAGTTVGGRRPIPKSNG